MSEPVRLLVCGGRDYADRGHVFAVLDRIQRVRGVAVVIHGAARGADALAGEWARSRGVEQIACPADWRRDGKAAGPIRNQSMIDLHHPTGAVAFPGGSGTGDMVRRAVRAGIGVLMPAEDAPKISPREGPNVAKA